MAIPTGALTKMIERPKLDFVQRVQCPWNPKSMIVATTRLMVKKVPYVGWINAVIYLDIDNTTKVLVNMDTKTGKGEKGSRRKRSLSEIRPGKFEKDDMDLQIIGKSNTKRMRRECEKNMLGETSNRSTEKLMTLYSKLMICDAYHKEVVDREARKKELKMKKFEDSTNTAEFKAVKKRVQESDERTT